MNNLYYSTQTLPLTHQPFLGHSNSFNFGGFSSPMANSGYMSSPFEQPKKRKPSDIVGANIYG